MDFNNWPVQNNWVLVGFMGAGKTTLAKDWAAQTGRLVFDLDDLIVKNNGLSIPDLFSLHGEKGFREIESTTLKQFLSQSSEPFILALGGGTPCFNDNMSLVNEKATSIFIDAPAEILYQRLKDQTESRPLLKGKSGNALLEFINTTLDTRRSFYEQAHYRYEVR